MLDRVKDMIVTGGENVYSAEVETVIYQHPAVLEAAVFGIPDAQWGELVMAIVALKPGNVLGADELIAHCRRSLRITRSLAALNSRRANYRRADPARSLSAFCVTGFGLNRSAAWPEENIGVNDEENDVVKVVASRRRPDQFVSHLAEGVVAEHSLSHIILPAWATLNRK